ncbi:unnamed protein product [Alopecurus aequalis]
MAPTSSSSRPEKVSKRNRRRRSKRTRIGGPCSADDSAGHSSWRDWGNLSCGPAGLIAELVLSNDIADYFRFGAACSAWRRSTVDPRGVRDGALDRRFHPRQWIMLQDIIGGVRPRFSRFLNISTGECIWMELPELDGRTVLAPTSEGLLVLLTVKTDEICLLNPFTGARTDLPPATTLLSGYEPDPFFPRLPGEALAVYGAGITEDLTVVINIGEYQMLAVARRGDEHWTKVKCADRIRGPILSFAGRVYCVSDKNIMVVETSPDHPPRLVMAAMLQWPLQFDNGGELMMVHRIPELLHYRHHLYSIDCDVYRVDLNAARTILVDNLDGRALYIGMRRTLSVPAGLSSFIAGDSVCAGFDCDGTQVSNRDSGKGVVHPHTIVECLCRYIGGHKTE